MGEQVAARFIRGRSSVGRAPALQAGGQEFESLRLHSKHILQAEGLRELAHRNPDAQENVFVWQIRPRKLVSEGGVDRQNACEAFRTTKERAIVDCECVVEAKRLKQRTEMFKSIYKMPYLENRIQKLILKISKDMTRHPR